MAYKWNCEEHDFHTGSGYAWGIHKRDLHGGIDPRPDVPVKAARRRAKPRNGSDDGLAGVVAELRSKRQAAIDELIRGNPEIQRIDAALAVLEKA